MQDYNFVCLLGNVGQKEDIIFQPNSNGQISGHFTLATHKEWYDKKIEKERFVTDWHIIRVIRPDLLEIMQSDIIEGAYVMVCGELRNKKYSTAKNNKITVSEITLAGQEAKLIILNRNLHVEKQRMYAYV